MKISILPKTYLGKWSVIVMLCVLILLSLGSVLPGDSGFVGFENLIHNPAQGILTVLLLAAGVCAIALALISLVMHKERSVLVFLALLIGLYSILGFVGSVAAVI